MYTADFELQVRQWAETLLDIDRVAHVRGMLRVVTDLAERYAPDHTLRVRLAAWIHDVAKNWDDEALLRYADTRRLPVTPTERAVPMLLHGAISYELAAARFALDDPLLQSACTRHTTGAPDMSIVDKIVFVGDLIEPTRNFRGVKAVRRAAEQDLDSAVLCGVDAVLRHLIRKQRVFDPRGIALHNQLISAGVRYPRRVAK
jgi:predicted HD superfamily hydrolase involved in NAD metabolism